MKARVILLLLNGMHHSVFTRLWIQAGNQWGVSDAITSQHSGDTQTHINHLLPLPLSLSHRGLVCQTLGQSQVGVSEPSPRQ